MNVPRIKGSHNAMLSGIMAAEAAAAALSGGRSHDELADYDAAWRGSPIGKDLWKVRNAKPLWSRFGTLAGITLGGLDMWTNTFGLSLFGTLKHGKPDYATLKPASECAPIAYPKPDGKLTFDRLSSVFLSNTNHEEDQPVHLMVRRCRCRSHPSTTSLPVRPRVIAPPASTSGLKRRARRNL